jgi:MFS family permease
VSSPFGATHRALTVGILMIVTVVALQVMGVSTALPDAARDLGGFDAYGWAFSAHLLAGIVGMVGAGQAADARGPVRAFLLGVVAFTAGSLLAAAAGSWTVLIAGRALQGLGNGVIGALVYVAVARAYPPALYGRMMALLSSAWVLPALIGPGIGGFVAEHAGWRWVFLGLLPLLPVAALLALPGLRPLERSQPTAVESRLWAAAALTVGAGAILGALQVGAPAIAVPLAVAGAALGAPAFRRLLPAGTLRARRGLPAGIAVRGLLGVGYLGGDAFMPLALTRLHGLTLSEAGLVVSAGALSWSAGAMLQGRLDRRDAGAGRARRIQLGGGILAAGVALATAGLVELGWPVAAAGWVLSGLGIGMGYPSVGALALSQAPGGEEGSVASALQLIETIGVAIFTGAAGAAIAAGIARDWPQTTAFALVFAAAAVAAAGAVVVGRRV